MLGSPLENEPFPPSFGGLGIALPAAYSLCRQSPGFALHLPRAVPFLAQAGTEGAKAAMGPPSPRQGVAEGSLTPGCWPMTHEEECAGPFWFSALVRRRWWRDLYFRRALSLWEALRGSVF